MIYLTRRERFSAAHRMFRQDWSDEKNMEVFGKCSNPNWHGHNYVLWVTIKGEPSENQGFVMNLKTIGQIELLLVQRLQQVIGKVRFGLVDFVNQQHGMAFFSALNTSIG